MSAVSHCQQLSFLSLIKCGGIGKLQSAVSSRAPAQPREGVPKTWEANKLLQHSITNAVRSHTSCVHTHIRQCRSQHTAYQPTVPEFLMDLSGKVEQSAALFWQLEAGVKQIRVPNSSKNHQDICICVVFSFTHKELDLGLSEMPTEFYSLWSVNSENSKKNLKTRMCGLPAHNMKVCRSGYALQLWNGAFWLLTPLP